MNELVTRSISGIIFIAILLLGTTYSQTSFIILYLSLASISIYEMWNILEKKSILPLVFVSLPFILLISLTGFKNDFDPLLVLYILILTWTFDSFAYLFGSRYGRNKILPKISPKKSWEGFFGGYISTLIISFILMNYQAKLLEEYIIIAFILPVTATVGDLIASYYKRKSNVKDYGKIIPGHGGIIDRLDAIFITIPVVFIIKMIQ
ncbi:MAG: phosphatidate cytidylyltransferase [Flavobacteriales bacterium]|nr:MAG: phosphatidate cytidylyltransferase [Flavobacteriales bacterium]